MINFVPIQTILVLSIGMTSEGNSLCFRKVKSRNKVDRVFTMPRFHNDKNNRFTNESRKL